MQSFANYSIKWKSLRSCRSTIQSFLETEPPSEIPKSLWNSIKENINIELDGVKTLEANIVKRMEELRVKRENSKTIRQFHAAFC